MPGGRSGGPTGAVGAGGIHPDDPPDARAVPPVAAAPVVGAAAEAGRRTSRTSRLAGAVSRRPPLSRGTRPDST